MTQCIFTKTDAKKRSVFREGMQEVENTDFGAKYIISDICLAQYQPPYGELALKHRLMCMQETIRLNRTGLYPLWTDEDVDQGISPNPKVVVRKISDFENLEIEHSNTDTNILNLIADKVTSESINPFSKVTISLSDRFFLSIFDTDDFAIRFNHLLESELISSGYQVTPGFTSSTLYPSDNQLIQDNLKMPTTTMGLTIKGWQKVRTARSPSKSNKAFIAMAFTNNENPPCPLDGKLREAVCLAVNKAKFEPVVVNQVHHNDAIIDKIISLINESRFIVAELTYQKSGVYYEAGYAKGRGLPVIHVVSEEDQKNCHFDVKHLNLVIWKDHDDLIEKLSNRIKATISRHSQID